MGEGPPGEDIYFSTRTCHRQPTKSSRTCQYCSSACLVEIRLAHRLDLFLRGLIVELERDHMNGRHFGGKKISLRDLACGWKLILMTRFYDSC